MFAGLAFVEILAYAVDRNEVVGIGLLHLAVERLGGLAVVLAALRVARITYLQPSAAIIDAATSPV